MVEYATLAAVDLGSNSFRLQISRVENEQLYVLDSMKDIVRFGAGLTADNNLDESSQQRALQCLARFAERLRGMPSHTVRVVATNTLRVARNAADFIAKAEKTLGFPIDVVSGCEEAHLIYLGAAHTLPRDDRKRLVIDVGGGSTELIIGRYFKALRTTSLALGCLSHSLRYFSDGCINAAKWHTAELAARSELQAIVHDFQYPQWQLAVGTSGTARALADIVRANAWHDSAIPSSVLEHLRQHLLDAGHIDRINIQGLRNDRRPVLAGGLVIMTALFAELGIEQMNVTLGALRDGILYDLSGRYAQQDQRELSVTRFMQRYYVDSAQADRVSDLAQAFYRQLCPQADITAQRLLRWAAQLHEIGLSVAYTSYHKHSAYILQHADMPGFSYAEQFNLAQLVLAHRGGLKKFTDTFLSHNVLQILALRLAVIFCRRRDNIAIPPLHFEVKEHSILLTVPDIWLNHNQLSYMALLCEAEVWKITPNKLCLSDNFNQLA